MKHNIELLDAELKEIIESQGKSSKAKVIRKLFDRLSEAISEGITLDMLVDYFRQKDLAITKNYLRNALYRIRKEQCHKSTSKQNPEITTITKPAISDATQQTTVKSTNQLTPRSDDKKENEKILDDILERFSAIKDLEGRYEVLGGNIEDFKNKSTNDQRQLVTNLKIKVMQKYGF
ncbi:hypothetical protein [Vibrio scophthalmi]|uniref:Uncharacterized protein n=1 Tax=Vibrio scophthalmi LMG 19158 TaxID=870967 RepID=F9RQP6_9VIBR|nr:hypothetical protein [Vibrio scophthalmi]EGU33977.1 hypothetical protein VIS19158_10989 [Vibrio scophthalmi LMG 19158]